MLYVQWAYRLVISKNASKSPKILNNMYFQLQFLFLFYKQNEWKSSASGLREQREEKAVRSKRRFGAVGDPLWELSSYGQKPVSQTAGS